MPITNNDHGGSQFEVLTVICNILESNRRKPMAEETIIAWCRPETLASRDSARSKVGKEINAWKNFLLIFFPDRIFHLFCRVLFKTACVTVNSCLSSMRWSVQGFVERSKARVNVMQKESCRAFDHGCGLPYQRVE